MWDGHDTRFRWGGWATSWGSIMQRATWCALHRIRPRRCPLFLARPVLLRAVEEGCLLLGARVLGREATWCRRGPVDSSKNGGELSMSMDVFIFDVDHGFAGLVVTPTGHGLMIDCGRHSSGFSPASWIRDNISLRPFDGKPLAGLVITHPHNDHIEDIDNLFGTPTVAQMILGKTPLRPARVWGRQYQWREVQPVNSQTKAFKTCAAMLDGCDRTVLQAQPSWGVDVLIFGLTPEEAKQIRASFVNNSSLVVSVQVTYGKEQKWQWLFGGDVETLGWEQLLKIGWASTLAGINFLVAPHHGHASGYCPKLLQQNQLLDLVVISARAGDEETCGDYYARHVPVGFEVNQKGNFRKVVSTRKDGTIWFHVDDNGLCTCRTGRLK